MADSPISASGFAAESLLVVTGTAMVTSGFLISMLVVAGISSLFSGIWLFPGASAFGPYCPLSFLKTRERNTMATALNASISAMSVTTMPY